jgi:hypothetical protein
MTEAFGSTFPFSSHAHALMLFHRYRGGPFSAVRHWLVAGELAHCKAFPPRTTEMRLKNTTRAAASGASNGCLMTRSTKMCLAIMLVYACLETTVDEAKCACKFSNSV